MITLTIITNQLPLSTKSSNKFPGYVPDRCGCCQVCARSEFELCDVSPDEGKYGICGDNLNCVEYQVQISDITYRDVFVVRTGYLLFKVGRIP